MSATTVNTNKRKISSEEEEGEGKAESEIAAAIKAAAEASPDEMISGLGGESKAVLYLKSNPLKKTQYNTTLAENEEPLLLTYFALQGLGEVPKLILAEAGMSYDCIAVMGGEDQSLATEWRSRSPNGLLPLLSGAGIPRSSPLSQSSAITIFLANKFGMTGNKTIFEATKVHELYETAKDLGAGSNKSDIAAVTSTKDYSVAKGPFALGKRIEKQILKMADPKEDTAVLNYGQIQLFYVLQSCETRRTNCVKESLGDVLDSFRVSMMNRSGLKEYLNSSARFPLTHGELGKDGYVYPKAIRRGDVAYNNA